MTVPLVKEEFGQVQHTRGHVPMRVRVLIDFLIEQEQHLLAPLIRHAPILATDN